MGPAQRLSRRGDAKIGMAREALIRSAFDPVRSVLRDDVGIDAEVRVHGVAALPALDATLKRWWSAEPDDPDVNLLLAVRRLDSLPWLQLDLWGQRTKEQRWDDEVYSLWRAVEHLQRTLAADPSRAAAKTWMAAAVGALVLRGAMPIEDFEVCATEAEAAMPDSLQVVRWRVHLTGARQDSVAAVMLAQQLSQAWGLGDPRHAELATAHIDRYSVLLAEDPLAAPVHWTREDVHSGLVAANAMFGAGGEGPGAVDASNVFAFALAHTREPQLAIPHFDRMDGYLLTWPWTVLQDPVLAHAWLEKQARKKSALLGRFRR